MRRSPSQLATRLIPVQVLDDLLARDRAEAERDLRHPWFREALDEACLDEVPQARRRRTFWWLPACLALLAVGVWIAV